jgi:hypothetical protein
MIVDVVVAVTRRRGIECSLKEICEAMGRARMTSTCCELQSSVPSPTWTLSVKGSVRIRQCNEMEECHALGGLFARYGNA